MTFAVLLASLLHPRIFRSLTAKALKPFGGGDIEPLPFPTALGLLLFYCGTWIIAGFAVWFMLLSLNASPPVSTVPYLGGVSAVGAIVAVLAVFAPSGLGAREASMYGLLLAVTSAGPALGVTLDEPARDHDRRGDPLRRRSGVLALRAAPRAGRDDLSRRDWRDAVRRRGAMLVPRQGRRERR